jgi:predicted hotdog family 3-hydroxylacyl-ACP dehydratase
MPAHEPSIAELIPHQGGMCLLERVLDWDEQRIALESTTHRDPNNPLRRDGRLSSVHLCEYGAQAMAVHGALKARAKGGAAAPGMLVSLRAVSFTCDYIDELRGALRIEATCLQASESSIQYEFRVTHDNAVLAEGRAAVVLAVESRRH